MPSRRGVVLGALAAALPWRIAPAHAEAARHAIAMHGTPAWPADFTAPVYANPDAPKGGQLVHPNLQPAAS